MREWLDDEKHVRTNSVIQLNVVLSNGPTWQSSPPLPSIGSPARNTFKVRTWSCQSGHSRTLKEVERVLLWALWSTKKSPVGRGWTGSGDVSAGWWVGGTGGGRQRIMVCGLGCLAPGAGRLDDVLRQPCTSLGDHLISYFFRNVLLSRPRAEGTRPLSDLLVSCWDGFHFQVGTSFKRS